AVRQAHRQFPGARAPRGRFAYSTRAVVRGARRCRRTVRCRRIRHAAQRDGQPRQGALLGGRPAHHARSDPDPRRDRLHRRIRRRALSETRADIVGLARQRRAASPALRRTRRREPRIIRLMTPPDFNALSDEEFRAKVREFFAEHYPPHLRFVLRRARLADMMDWYLTLSRHGWIAPNWPREYGGMGLDTGKMLILLEESERYGVSRVPDHGIVQVGPILMKYGSAEQKKYYLPKILSGDHIWGQGYSEPNAGSDLASLMTSAVPDGNDFIVNGQKIWTTLAHDSTHLYTLVRTSKEGKKQEGISFLLIDAKS